MRKNIVISLCGMVSVIVVVAIPNYAFAHTHRYWNGYNDGQQMGLEDYNDVYSGHNYYKPFCPTDHLHTSNYCAGFIDGYNAQWTSLAPGFMSWHWARVSQQFKADQQVDQNSNVSINGDNNRVMENQQASNNADQQTGNNDGYAVNYPNSESDESPRCEVLCANIQVR
jgi:hypothetical protein